MPAEFSHGLFGCFDNCCICIVTYFIPCYTAGKIAEKLGENCILYGIIHLIPGLNIICGGCIRQRVREQKGIAGGIITDVLTFLCCNPCALVQEAQELQAFGTQQAQSIARE